MLKQRLSSKALLSLGIVCLLAVLPDDEASSIRKHNEGEKIQMASHDTSLFAVVASWLASNNLRKRGRSFPLRIDPRPLRADVDKSGFVLNLDLEAEDFADVSRDEIERRRAVLERLKISPADALKTMHECVGTGFTPPPPDPETGETRDDGPVPEHCRFTTVALSQPRHLRDDIRAVQVVRLTPSSFHVYDLMLRRESKEWRVAQVFYLNGIMS